MIAAMADSRSFRAVGAVFLAISAIGAVSVPVPQSVRATGGWIQRPAQEESEALAFVTVENGTMYDVYIVGAEGEIAGRVELRDAGSGTPARIEEARVPAFDSLVMSPKGVHLALAELKRALTPGETVSLVLSTDGGDRLSVAAVVK
jgi:copper(I)-binding protein